MPLVALAGFILLLGAPTVKTCSRLDRWRAAVGHSNRQRPALHFSMALPNAELACIEPEKIRDYLLSPTHPIGRFKAMVFTTALGYNQAH